MLISRQRNGHFAPAVRYCPQTVSPNVGNGNGEEIDGPAMFKLVDALGKRWIEPTTKHVFDA
jgi:hypothetical protein